MFYVANGPFAEIFEMNLTVKKLLMSFVVYGVYLFHASNMYEEINFPYVILPFRFE